VEQAAYRSVDQGTDQFSLGLILHEMVTGRPTFRCDTPSPGPARAIEREAEALVCPRAVVPVALSRWSQAPAEGPGAAVREDDELGPRRWFGWLTAAARARAGLIPSRSQVGMLARSATFSRPRRRSVSPAPLCITSRRGDKVRDYDEDKLAVMIRRGS
jgi:hypothetical protein